AGVMVEVAEIFFGQPVERRAEQFCGAADEIMHLRLERAAVAVVPALGRDIAVLHEHRRRVPVLRLALEPIAALEDEDALARRREVSRERAAAGAAADDDDVEALIHMRLARACSFALETRTRCALGVLPSPPELGLGRVRHF